MIIPIQEIYIGMLIVCRCTALLFSFPFGNEGTTPPTVKVFLSCGLSYLLLQSLPIDPQSIPFPSNYLELFGAILKETLIGLCMGLIVKISFAIVELAGYFIANEIGINNSEILNPHTEHSNSFMSILLFQLMGVIFFTSNAYQDILQCFINSYQYLGIGLQKIQWHKFSYLIEDSRRIFTVALKIAAPLMVLNFLVTFAFSILGKATPKINIFFLSFPVRIITGICLFSLLAYLCGGYILESLAQTSRSILQFFQ